jgi:four helix bundle protein
MVDGKTQKINSFEQLTVWQESQELAVLVYGLTKDFPKEEQFGITSQLRRAASSVSANIAEGFGRLSVNDKQHFLTIAYGSLLETKNFLYLANRLGYITAASLERILPQIISCQKLINAYKRSIK